GSIFFTRLVTNIFFSGATSSGHLTKLEIWGMADFELEEFPIFFCFSLLCAMIGNFANRFWGTLLLTFVFFITFAWFSECLFLLLQLSCELWELDTLALSIHDQATQQFWIFHASIQDDNGFMRFQKSLCGGFLDILVALLDDL
ncbi:hypothetical protein ACJX0J_040230, partial [Zea mays]